MCVCVLIIINFDTQAAAAMESNSAAQDQTAVQNGMFKSPN